MLSMQAVALFEIDVDAERDVGHRDAEDGPGQARGLGLRFGRPPAVGEKADGGRGEMILQDGKSAEKPAWLGAGAHPQQRQFALRVEIGTVEIAAEQQTKMLQQNFLGLPPAFSVEPGGKLRNAGL